MATDSVTGRDAQIPPPPPYRPPPEYEPPPTAETTEEQRAEKLAQQSRTFTEVPTFREYAQLALSTENCRIDDLGSRAFEPTDPKAAARRVKIVEDARAAMEALEQNGRLEMHQARFVATEVLVSLGSGLLPSADVQQLFGIEGFPIGRMSAAVQAFTDGRAQSVEFDVEQDCLGALVLRAWKVLIQTEPGRAVLLSCGQQSVEEMHPDHLNSFEAVELELAARLVDGDLFEMFRQWLAMLPYTQHPTRTALTRSEKQLLLEACEAGTLDWHRSRRKGWPKAQ